MNQQHRLNLTLELVTAQGRVSIAEVSEALGVSAATVRRDLNQLAEQQLVLRTHGGASVLSHGDQLPLRYRLPRQANAKTAIAERAAQLVRPGMTVALNGGTTTGEVARALARSERLLSADGDPSVTLLTNALNIAYELTLRQQFRMIVTGGQVRPKTYELVGTVVEGVVAEFTTDLAILGVDGVSAGTGATTHTQEEALVGRWLAERAKRVVIVADHSKLGADNFARLFPIQQVNMLITDSGADPEQLDAFAEAGVEVVVADVTESAE